MPPTGVRPSLGRSSVVILVVAVCVTLLATMIPAAVSAEQGEKREYIVTIEVKDSGRSIRPATRAAKVRIRQRAKAAGEATREITQRNGVKARYQYGNVITGFSARMTRAEARKLARDPSVTSVRVSQIYRTAATSDCSGNVTPCVADGIKRVKAYDGSSRRDITANVAVLDTGIGPAQGNGEPISMITDELEIAGGWNCAGTVPTQQAGETSGEFQARLADYRGRWGDVNGHGTHVAGIIGARDNAYGAVGVAPGANLYSVRVFGGNGVGSDAAIVCGLDWVLATHTNADPDIDVVNMSIQGPRANQLEDCGAVNADSSPNVDIMHQAICRLHTANIPVVASAGNDGINANLSSPGGYNQVITVGAMTDTDGVGWEQGNNAGCGSYGTEKDDTFADYSNHGTDVDIVAPGTCVWSTAHLRGDGTPSQRGDWLVRSTGTSMAAPHVTGAVARYVHAKGSPASVSEIRQLIRAAGRMDWDARTDPVWYGVNDPDPPNRVLDVAALTAGSPAVKTFLYHQSFDIGGSQNSRTTRVDVQRIGGFAGEVTLSSSGLPGSVGSVSFVGGNKLNGLGKNQLGTNVRFDLDADGPEDVYNVVVTANGPTVAAHPRGITLTIDRTPPSVAGLRPRIRGQKAGVTRTGSTQVYLQWEATDGLSGVKSTLLQRKMGKGAWKNAGVSGASSARVWLKPGQDNRFRVRATDEVGNVKNSYSIPGRLAIRDSKNGALNKTGSWKTKKVKQAYGGSLLIATAGTATVKTKFDGRAVAVLAPVGNGRGKFRIRVDDGAWQTVNTKMKSGAQRRVVWTAKLDNGSHKIEIQRVSGQPALDGIIFVR